MSKNNISILTIILISTILRFYKLGVVPLGLSIDEVKFGLILSKVSTIALNPAILRAPFAILGVFSVYLMYVFAKRTFNKGNIPLFSAFLLSVTPWHLQESRIYSLGIFILVIVQLTTLFLQKHFGNKTPKIYANTLIVLLLLVSIAIPVKGVSDSVNADRLLISKTAPKVLSRVFVNKIIQNYKEREKLFFDNLDFGNYFFSGHPRERWGVEEKQKLYLFMLPLVFFGLLKVEEELRKKVITYFVLCLALLTLFKVSGSQGVVFVLPFVFLASIGADFRKKLFIFEKVTLSLFIIISTYEIVSFQNIYFSNQNNSLFSPRRTVYQDLVSKVSEIKSENTKVLVNDRLGNSPEYFGFYLKNNINDYEFRSYNIFNETADRNKIYVDILPNDSGPVEPLYTKDGSWPNLLDVVQVFEDREKRAKIVIYKIK